MDRIGKIVRITRPRKELKEKLLCFYNASFPKSQWSAAYLDSFFKKKNEGICFVLKERGEIMGFALGKIQHSDEVFMTLCALYLDLHLRGSGRGAEIMKIFLEQTFQSGFFKKVILHFRDSNDLRIFYEKSGFENHSIQGVYSNGEIKHQMEFLKKI